MSGGAEDLSPVLLRISRLRMVGNLRIAQPHPCLSTRHHCRNFARYGYFDHFLSLLFRCNQADTRVKISTINYLHLLQLDKQHG